MWYENEDLIGFQENVGADEFNEKVKVEYDVARPSEGCGDIVLRDG